MTRVLLIVATRGDDDARRRMRIGVFFMTDVDDEFGVANWCWATIKASTLWMMCALHADAFAMAKCGG